MVLWTSRMRVSTRSRRRGRISCDTYRRCRIEGEAEAGLVLVGSMSIMAMDGVDDEELDEDEEDEDEVVS